MGKPRMGVPLSGKISDRIRSGELDKDVDIRVKGSVGEVPPEADSVRYGSGQGLGGGATRRRSGD